MRVVVQLSDSLGYVSGKSLFLNVSPRSYYFVEGYIYNTEGHKIPAALVEIAGNTVTTNADGYYKINDLLPGNYTLTVSKNEHNFAPIEITVGEDEPNKISMFSDVVGIQEPPANGDTDGSGIDGDYTAYGTIRDELGNKLEGVEVQAAGQTVTTDDAGN